MAEDRKWYCVIVSSTAYYGKTEAVVEELKGVLSPSPAEFLVINDPEIVKTGEYFIFISCKAFMKKRDNVLHLSCVERIQSVSDVPYRFSEKEVSVFAKSIEKKEKETVFKRGDVVSVKDGYLKNLFGLVFGNRDGKVNVLFRFHVRDFHEMLEPKQLKYEKNIFDFMPSNMERREWFRKFTEK